MAETTEKRIQAALAVAEDCGQVDGSHHKAYAIDQMVRCLTGCPTVKLTGKMADGTEYTYDGLGESDEYRTFVAGARFGFEGPDTYEWDTGIAP